MNSVSIRTRLTILILLSALPAFAVALYTGFERYKHADAMAREKLAMIASSAAAGLEAGMSSGATDLRMAQEISSRIAPPEDGRLAILSADGTVLASRPAGPREGVVKEQNAAVLEAARGGRTEPFFGSDADGIRRLYMVHAAKRARDATPSLFAVASAPARSILSDAYSALLHTGLGIFVATSARTHFPASEEELSQLGSALDDMAQALQKRDTDLKQALRSLGEQVITDPLTRLNNRRYLWDFLGRDLIRARRAVLPVAAILFDIDHFKRFNDTLGHEAGDLVLKAVADVIRRNVRGSDIACRYGGEEFIVVLPEATRTVAVQRAETIRQDIERMEVVLGDKPLNRVTASFGIALYPTHADNAEALVRAADDALYQAKEAGRNRVHVFEAAPSLL
jgi:diguanylate cyclase (GGDEF)-like protein